jgi:putative serine protease PepD
VLAKVEPAVVTITSSGLGAFGNSTGAGTGMVLTADGEVLTNAHVVSGATSIRVAVPGKGSHPAHVLGVDVADDVAVVKMDAVSGLSTVAFGASSTLHVGDPVVAVGNALDLQGGPTVTSGIISALNRQIDTESGQLSHLIQTQAPINPGNSGGPLLDSAGRVIGMNTAVAGDAQNIGFAIAVDQIKPLITRLEKGDGGASTAAASGGYVGVSVDDAQTATGGAVVTQVVTGSPAAQAGLQAGDVVVAVDGRSVAGAADLVSAIRSHAPGDRVRLTILRNGQQGGVTVTLTSRPA